MKTDSQIHLLPWLFVQVDGVQITPAHCIHIGLVTLTEVDYLQTECQKINKHRPRTCNE